MSVRKGRHHGPQPQKPFPYQFVKAPPVPRTTRRPCLGPLCMGQRDMNSEGSWHRQCGRCRAESERRARGCSPMAFSAGAAGGANEPVGE
jgi:hypothetical protein